MFTRNAVRGADNRVEIVDGWPSLDAVLAEMAASAWEEPSNTWMNFVVNDETGEVVASSLFGPGLDLLITCADGRRLRVEIPAQYSEEA
jgi:hypothetical protein